MRHDPIARVAGWLSPAVPEEADIVIGVDGGGADDCVAMTVYPLHDPVWINYRSFEIDNILRFFSAAPHRFLTCEEVVALELLPHVDPCRACGCPERAQSHCDRWDCPRLLPDRSGEVA